jgi:hypothetical protein
MACQILVENLVGVKGAISVIAPMGQPWTHNETLAAWRLRFPVLDITEYHRNFTLVIITDKEVSDLSYLTEAIIVDGDPVGVAWSFAEPSSSSPEWIELFATGQIEKTFYEIQPYLFGYS